MDLEILCFLGASCPSQVDASRFEDAYKDLALKYKEAATHARAVASSLKAEAIGPAEKARAGFTTAKAELESARDWVRQQEAAAQALKKDPAARLQAWMSSQEAEGNPNFVPLTPSVVLDSVAVAGASGVSPTIDTCTTIDAMVLPSAACISGDARQPRAGGGVASSETTRRQGGTGNWRSKVLGARGDANL